jgi:hypothetical protein
MKCFIEGFLKIDQLVQILNLGQRHTESIVGEEWRLLGCYPCGLLVTASIVPSSSILVTLMKEALSSSETLFLTRATRRNIPEDAILHSHRHENLKSYIALTGWRHNVSPVRYELGFYIPVDDILHSHRHENLKSYIALTGWTL